MVLLVNGEQRDVTSGISLQQLLTDCGFNSPSLTAQPPVVVAVNGEHVPSDQLTAVAVSHGDAIEVLAVRQGG